MTYGTRDWLNVVYGAGLEVEPGEAGGPAEIRVRASPSPSRLSPGEPRRFRVTVSPSDASLSWRLYLRDLTPGPGGATSRGVWWRLYPGTWQPLGGTRECVAEGRGRVRVDVTIRVEPGVAPSPTLRFVAEVR